MSSLTALVDRPKPADINGGLSALSARTLLAVLGNPRSTYTDQCQPVTNPALKRRIITTSVGPFRVTGLDIAARSLAEVMEDIRSNDPALYAALGTAGMLCARLVRGSAHTVSNHAWGTAVDLTINKVLDRRGDGYVQAGLLRAYAYFHKHGWYWGAEYSTEDGMHFELAQETFLRLMGR